MELLEEIEVIMEADMIMIMELWEGIEMLETNTIIMDQMLAKTFNKMMMTMEELQKKIIMIMIVSDKATKTMISTLAKDKMNSQMIAKKMIKIENGIEEIEKVK